MHLPASQNHAKTHSSEQVTFESNTSSMADGPHLHQIVDIHWVYIYGRTPVRLGLELLGRFELVTFFLTSCHEL
jgi:hypothetical protein